MKALLLGDISPTKNTSELFAAGKVDELFTDTRELFVGNDINLVNVECALTDHEQGIEKFGPCIKTPPSSAKTLAELGVNYACLSNNHVFDFGKQGALDTIKALGEANITYTGFGMNYEDSRRDLVIENNGERIVIICVCEHEYSYALEDRMGSRPFDEFETMLDIRRAKESADRVIVTYHGGKEQCEYPSPRLRKACRAMAAHGADVVLCQHSHCIGCYEEYEGCHILYGQGNFHFVFVNDDTLPENWHDSLAVKYDTVSDEIEFIPVTEGENGEIRLAKGEEATRIMNAFEARNKELANGEWKKGWHAFCERKAPHYIRAITRAYAPETPEKYNHLFAHYLDCEAHSDVWRELCPTANQTNEK